MPSKLAYWNIRGLCQYVRLVLRYVQEDYEEKIYKYEGEGRENLVPPVWPPEDVGIEWFQKDKKTVDLDFPNLPYYMDDKVKLTQSMAIIRYLGRKYDLYGKTLEEQGHVDMLGEQAIEMIRHFYKLCYDPKFDEKNGPYLEKLNDKHRLLERYLGDNQWFVGNQTTWVDLMLFEILDRHQHCWPDCFKSFPKLDAFLERIRDLPQIKAYMASDVYFKNAVEFPFATFGGQKTA